MQLMISTDAIRLKPKGHPAINEPAQRNTILAITAATTNGEKEKTTPNINPKVKTSRKISDS